MSARPPGGWGKPVCDVEDMTARIRTAMDLASGTDMTIDAFRALASVLDCVDRYRPTRGVHKVPADEVVAVIALALGVIRLVP